MSRNAVAQFQQNRPLRDMTPGGGGRIVGNEEKKFTKVFPDTATLNDVWLWIQKAQANIVALTFESEDSDFPRADNSSTLGQ